jgi:plasmid maintenance system antidote protein VapI
MNDYLEKYKGIHPGIILEREFKKRALHQRPFALSIGEHPQTINAITKGKRKLNTALALKIEGKLGFDEGSLAILQTYFDINEEKHKIEKEKQRLAEILARQQKLKNVNKTRHILTNGFIFAIIILRNLLYF